MSKTVKKRHNLFYAIIAAPRAGKTTFAFELFKGKKGVIWITPHTTDEQKVKEAGFIYVDANKIEKPMNLLKLKNKTLIFDDITATDLADTRGVFLYRLAAKRGHNNLDVVFIAHGFNHLAPKAVNLLNMVTVGASGDRDLNFKKVPIWFTDEHIKRYESNKQYEFFTVESGSLLK